MFDEGGAIPGRSSGGILPERIVRDSRVLWRVEKASLENLDGKWFNRG